MIGGQASTLLQIAYNDSTTRIAMGSRSKKPKKTKLQLSQGKKFSKSEDLGYYFLAAIGLVIMALLVVGMLGYFKLI